MLGEKKKEMLEISSSGCGDITPDESPMNKGRAPETVTRGESSAQSCLCPRKIRA